MTYGINDKGRTHLGPLIRHCKWLVTELLMTGIKENTGGTQAGRTWTKRLCGLRGRTEQSRWFFLSGGDTCKWVPRLEGHLNRASVRDACSPSGQSHPQIQSPEPSPYSGLPNRCSCWLPHLIQAWQMWLLGSLGSSSVAPSVPSEASPPS